jgi:hypothetical protein
MEKNICAETGKPEGLLIGYEMNIMSLVRKRLPQFSGQYPASTESRITNDPNIHGRNL